jgi:hypothetical protein
MNRWVAVGLLACVATVPSEVRAQLATGELSSMRTPGRVSAVIWTVRQVDEAFHVEPLPAPKGRS